MEKEKNCKVYTVIAVALWITKFHIQPKQKYITQNITFATKMNINMKFAQFCGNKPHSTTNCLYQNWLLLLVLS